MSKRPRTDPHMPAGPVSRRTLLGGAVLGTGNGAAASGGSPPAEPDRGDADLLAWCVRVHRMEVGLQDEDDGRDLWDSAVRHVAALPALTAAGLQAKARLLLALLPHSDAAGPGAASPDEQLLWSLIQDVLGTN